MFVVGLAGLQAVVQLAEELVEQVPLSLAMPSHWWRGGRRSDGGRRARRAVLPLPRSG